METLDDPTPKRRPYPNTGQAIVLLLICIGFTLFFSIAQAFLADYLSLQASFLVMYIFIFGCTLAVGVRWKRKHEPFFRFSFRGIPWLAYPVLYMVTVSVVNLSFPLTDLIPMPDAIKKLFEELMGQGNLFMFLAAVIAAPIFEELLFRGIILNGLLRHYSPIYAILLSSFLFGIAHLNPWQFIVAFLMGGFLGWVYYRTKSVLPCIAIHFFANGTSFLISSTLHLDASMTAIAIYGGAVNLIIGIAISLVLISGGIYLLHRLFQKTPPWHLDNEDAND